MAKLVYSMLTSLDGYVEDAQGNFDWAAPDDEVHTFINELIRPAGTHLYGRRMYEVMRFWETAPTDGDEPEAFTDFARLWRAADKIVCSTQLVEASSLRTRIEPNFDPAAIALLKATSERDISISGPTIASLALAAGLVDECHFFVVPTIIGGGKPALPSGFGTKLELLNERSFSSGTVHLHYRITT